jgi:hypothetical protein
LDESSAQTSARFDASIDPWEKDAVTMQNDGDDVATKGGHRMIRERLLTFCAAVWGLAVAIALLPRWTRPAPPGQLPGFATSAGFDAQAPFYFIAGVIVLPVLAAALMHPWIARLCAPETRAWARVAAAIAMLLPIWLVLIEPDLLWTTLPTAVAVMVCVALRGLPARFTRRDVILLPTTAAVFLAIIDLTGLGVEKQFVLAVAIVISVRLAIVLVRSRVALPASLCFALAPLALVFQTRAFSYAHRHFGWTPLAIVVITPFLLRLFVHNTPVVRHRLRRLVVYAIFPIAVYSYLAATSLTTAEGKPRLSFFEEAHHLTPASEALRGERFYRDIIPSHGLINDGLLDVVLLRGGLETMGQDMKGRYAIASLCSVAVYALTTAATGSPEAGILAYHLGRTEGATRVLPALLTLALMVSAVRQRNPRLLAWAGAGAIVTGLTSIDHGVYISVALLFAMTRVRRGWRFAALGAAAAAVPALLVLSVAGIVVPFFKTSIFELATLGPAYALTPFNPPAIFKTFTNVPELLAATFDRGASLTMIWIAALLFVAVALTTRPPALARRRARYEALLTICIWMVIVAFSYAERQHFHFQTAVPPFLIGGAMYAAARRRWVIPVAVVLLLMIAQPTAHLAHVASLRHATGPLDPKFSSVLYDPPRAGDALWPEADATTIGAAGVYINRLAPEDTFFDFTNSGLLYFLFNCDCPIRQVEVAFYEREDLQREVIARIERNPHVVAALVILPRLRLGRSRPQSRSRPSRLEVSSGPLPSRLSSRLGGVLAKEVRINA